MSIAIIDYDIGNIKSIMGALKACGASSVLTREPEQIMASDGVILPGVGAFRKAMESLYNYQIVKTIKDFAASGRPLLGICLGMQLFFEESEEFGIYQGLGIIPGRTQRFSFTQGRGERLPHVGWSSLRPAGKSWHGTPLSFVTNDDSVYFVHSYVTVPADQKDLLAVTTYGGVDFCAAVQKDNVFGCQFHPEKSGKVGLGILNQFVQGTHR